MFEVITTGKNLNYGKSGEKKMLSDIYIISALKNGWVKPNVKYIGDGRPNLIIIPVYDKCRICGQVKPRAR